MADQGRGGARDLSRAVAKYDEACATGSSTACTNLGFLYEKGTGVKKDSARAVALFQRGCDGSRCQPANLGGCVNVGRAYRDGIGVEKNPSRAASIFQRPATESPIPTTPAPMRTARAPVRSSELCTSRATASRETSPGGGELTELGCERCDPFGCFNAVVIFTNGSGVEADLAKTASFLDRACQGGDGENHIRATEGVQDSGDSDRFEYVLQGPLGTEKLDKIGTLQLMSLELSDRSERGACEFRVEP